MSHVLQHLVMPNLSFGAPEEMYARLHNDKVHALMSEGRMLFEAGGRASFDTFFNSVTVGVWKTHTAVQDLQLHLRGSGRFIVRLGLHRIGHAHRWLAERVVTLTLEQDIVLPIESWSNLESGMLYFALEALESGSITEGHFATLSTPQQEVKLGIVITHFNRKQWVLPAIARIRNELLKDPLYKDRIELVVVDNSQNITTEEAEGVTLIPNKNLGGSGGFTRGLLYLKDRQNFTHCLFMDDDASCEIESIRRALALMSYRLFEGVSVSGSLLREIEPYRLFEKGAKFDGHVKPLKSGLDMRHVHDLLNADDGSSFPEYGAWWFFIFPINHIKYYPFPFFVRGDDIRFGLDNKFKILTLNGIGCWGDDFVLKSSPLTTYLDSRSHLIQGVFDECDIRKSVVTVTRFFVSQIFSYNYASAQSVVKAIRDFLKGPSFFVENIDTSIVRKDIAHYSSAEKLMYIDRANTDVDYPSYNEGKTRRAFRLLTLNGLLIPSFFMRKRALLHPKSFRASFRSVFMYKTIIYEYEPTGMGYITRHEKIKILIGLFKFCVELARLIQRYQSVKSLYMQKKQEMTSEAFWREIYTK